MDTSYIYEKVLLIDCFNKIKTLRNGWLESEKMDYGSLIIDIGGNDYRQHKFIMENSEGYIYDTIPCLVMELMNVHGIPFQAIHYVRENAHVYSVKQFEYWPEYVHQSNSRDIFAFFINKPDSKKILYIFKEFGIGYRLPKTLIEKTLRDNGLDKYCYVSMVEDKAYAEVIDHNNNDNDPTRGTGIFSLKQLFLSNFGQDEYDTFRKYADIFTDKVKGYLGFELVRTLRPNTLSDFKGNVRENLLNFTINDLDPDGRVSDSQREIIYNRYFKEGRYELLTGKKDFAQSFMTAEWLYSSLSGAENIDLTAIAMGYFKAIEQLLFQFVKLHTLEKDNVERSIYANGKGDIKLTDASLSDKSIIKDINLGSLTGFFGYYKSKTKEYFKRNQDLLADDIEEATYEYIIEVFTGIVGLRNGYFHKHNLNEWDKVVAARDNARLIFCLLLGAYKLDVTDEDTLGIIRRANHDDYYKLCKYMNDIVYQYNRLVFPVVYLSGIADEYDFWSIYQDDFIEYDNYGEPLYSGVYIHRLRDKHIYRLTKGNNLPNEIWIGTLSLIFENNIFTFKLTGPKKMIYKDDHFLGEGFCP